MCFLQYLRYGIQTYNYGCKKLACNLTSYELSERKENIIANLKTEVLAKQEIETGFRYTFKGSDAMLEQLIAFIKSERICCPFFTFSLTIEDNNSVAILTITGPEGAKEFIISDLGL